MNVIKAYNGVGGIMIQMFPPEGSGRSDNAKDDNEEITIAGKCDFIHIYVTSTVSQ